MAQDTKPEPDLLTSAASAERLNISVRTLWRLVATGQFPQPKRYNRKLVRWPTQVVRRWLAQQAADEGE
jgi:predicted DNA-binding transcriptional regulator AlpA